MTPSEARIGLALLSFTVGAIVGGLAQVRIGYVGLLAPIAALLVLIPIGRQEIRAVAKFGPSRRSRGALFGPALRSPLCSEAFGFPLAGMSSQEDQFRDLSRSRPMISFCTSVAPS